MTLLNKASMRVSWDTYWLLHTRPVTSTKKRLVSLSSLSGDVYNEILNQIFTFPVNPVTFQILHSYSTSSSSSCSTFISPCPSPSLPWPAEIISMDMFVSVFRCPEWSENWGVRRRLGPTWRIHETLFCSLWIHFQWLQDGLGPPLSREWVGVGCCSLLWCPIRRSFAFPVELHTNSVFSAPFCHSSGPSSGAKLLRPARSSQWSVQLRWQLGPKELSVPAGGAQWPSIP